MFVARSTNFLRTVTDDRMCRDLRQRIWMIGNRSVSKDYPANMME